MAINPETFNYKESRWMDIYTCLKNHGFDVYSPGQKEGECTEPYIVVKNDGGYNHLIISTFREQYSIIVCVPKKQYSKLEPLVKQVREAMKELYPMLRFYGQIQPSVYDDVLKLHQQSIEYECYKKN